jgi:hypothetical protein
MKSSLEKYRRITRQEKEGQEKKEKKTNDKKYKNKTRTRIIE